MTKQLCWKRHASKWVCVDCSHQWLHALLLWKARNFIWMQHRSWHCCLPHLFMKKTHEHGLQCASYPLRLLPVPTPAKKTIETKANITIYMASNVLNMDKTVLPSMSLVPPNVDLKYPRSHESRRRCALVSTSTMYKLIKPLIKLHARWMFEHAAASHVTCT